VDHTVTTRGHGAVVTAPDAMRLDVAVRATAASVSEALAAVADGVRRLGEAARGHTPGTQVSSRDLHVHDHYDERDRRSGVVAEHQLRLMCALDTAGALVSDLGAALGDRLRVDRVTPVVSEPAPLEVRARQAAFEDAQAKAEQLAALAGRSLGPAVEIVEGATLPLGPRVQPASMESMPFEPGSSEVTATVTVRWELGQA
jgi:uncharacterized protein YggE